MLRELNCALENECAVDAKVEHDGYTDLYHRGIEYVYFVTLAASNPSWQVQSC